MSVLNINILHDLWASTLLKHNESPPFANHMELYNTIDSMPLGDVAWQSFSLRYNGDEVPEGTNPQWMTSEYDVWFHDLHIIIKNMISNPDYNHHANVTPVWIFNSNGIQVYQNFMSGDWAWEEAVSSSPSSHRLHKLSKNRPAHCTLRVIKLAVATFLKLTLFKGRPTFLKPFKIGAADVFAFLESL